VRLVRLPALVPAAALALAACASTPSTDETPVVDESRAAGAPAGGRLVATVTGLSGPEAVKYDPARDVYYVSNFGPSTQGAPATDDNGFISRVNPDGTMRDLRWIAGGERGATLHMPRGMALGPRHLWVADADAVRAFDLETGAPAGSVSFAGQNPGFLNDLAFGPDGRLYVTDTPRNRVYRLDVSNPASPSQTIEVAVADTALGSPNGITYDARNARMILLPYGGRGTLHAWRPGTATLEMLANGSGARYDGVELLSDGALVVSSQRDSSIHVYRGGSGGPAIRGLPGPPADIALDTRRHRVAIPYIALNTVQIWEMPRR